MAVSRILPLRRCNFGFTLLELLVVLIIIGIIVSFAVISASRSSPQDQLEQQSKRLLVLLRLATQDAVMRDRQIGMHIREDGYSFLVLQDGRWEPLENDEILRPRTLPDGFRLELLLESIEVSLGSAKEEDKDKKDKDKDKEPEPQVWLLSSGETMPFELLLRYDALDSYYALTGDANGLFELEGPIDRF